MTTNHLAISNGNNSDHGVACVVDLDNILHRGFDRRTGLARSQGVLDVAGFSSQLKARGVDRGTICRNWQFSKMSQSFWGGLGLSVSAARSNCDSQVIAEARRYVANGVRTLVLVSGDSDYCKLVGQLRACGVYVEVWARRSSASHQLTRMANRVQHIDNLVLSPAPTLSTRTADNDAAVPAADAGSDLQRVWAPQFGIRQRRKPVDHHMLPSDAAA